jgi:hypothetical protein
MAQRSPTKSPRQRKGTGANDAQARVQALPEGQRNAVLIRAIRDANLVCQQVTQSSSAKTTTKLPVFEATCEDGAVYAIAYRDDGTAAVEPMAPARAR